MFLTGLVALWFIAVGGGVSASTAESEDWPTWRHDAKRSAVSSATLPDSPCLLWVRELPRPRPAWPPNQEKLQFDLSYEAVVTDKTLLVPSMVGDHVSAYETATGALKWRFYADGPVRFAPVAEKGRVYFLSDDGYLYCLDAERGGLLWKFRGGSSARRVIGNHRLISTWPARGAPVLFDGTVYFAAGIWPFMGVFVHALNAETGKVIWTNSGIGSSYMVQVKEGSGFGTVAPQGYLAATRDHLIVPGGRTLPMVLRRCTGELVCFQPLQRQGGYDVCVHDGWFFNRGQVCEATDSREIGRWPGWACVGGRLINTGPGGWLEVRGLVRENGPEDRPKLRNHWKGRLPITLSRVHLRAGSRLYGSGPDGRIAAVDIPQGKQEARVSWQTRVEGEVWTMVAADGKLFVVTREGTIFCFGSPTANGTRRWREVADGRATGRSSEALDLIGATDVRAGYCVLLQPQDAALLETLARRTELQIVALRSEPTVVEAFRRHLDRVGLYGARMAVHASDVVRAELPPYFANLIVVSAEAVPSGREKVRRFIECVFRSLRPYGGIACLPAGIGETRIRELVHTANLANAEVALSGRWILLKRTGALPGAGSWTHQYGDCANTVVSQDARVKPPLGLLWFGGPDHEKILPRHGCGPSPQVIDGRLIIEGPHSLLAMDVYTGRTFWERRLPDLGKYFDYTGKSTGANAQGTNYVATHDAVYVAYRSRCLRLDPATGKTTAEFSLPRSPGEEEHPEVGYLGVYEDCLIATALPIVFYDPGFLHEEFGWFLRKNRYRNLERLMRCMAQWSDVRPRPAGEEDIEYIVRSLNRAIGNPKMDATIPDDDKERALSDPGSRMEVQRLLKQIREHLRSRRPQAPHDKQLRTLNRRLLEKYYAFCALPVRKPILNRYSLDRLASRRLVCLDRHTGSVRWTYTAEQSLRHNGIVVGAGKLFCLDLLPVPVAERRQRRGLSVTDRGRLVAFDVRTGEEIWSRSDQVFGTWLSYSAEHDILLQAGSSAVNRPRDEAKRGMIAHRGATGEILWRNDLEYGGPVMLYSDVIMARRMAVDLLTGRPKMRKHPLTGREVPWCFTRSGGCDTPIGSKYLITFRSSEAGYYDMSRRLGTGNLGGFRSGCTANLIVADGVLSAPDYTRTCTCSFQNQTSLALVHDPDVEMWTYTAIERDPTPIRQLGLNFGAPGDRLDDRGTLWLDYPSTGGPSPDPRVRITPKSPRWFRFHASRMAGPAPGWITASGVEGLRELHVKLGPEDAPSRRYTLRLHFAEVEPLDKGQRVFHVALQGKAIIRNFDILAQAGARNRGFVKEFRGIEIADELHLTLQPASSNSSEPVICGLEVIADGW